MKLQWLISSIVWFLIFCSPVNAGKLLSWEFKPKNTRLVFTTEEGVQPRAKLVANPTRLVVELPGTTLNRKTVKEKFSGAIRNFRIGQSNEDTVSLVVELRRGYTFDPQRIKFRRTDSNSWEVEIPDPRIGDTSETIVLRDIPQKTLPPVSPRISLPPVKDPLPPLKPDIVKKPRYITKTSHGFLIDIEGDRSNTIVPRRTGDIVDFELQGVKLPKGLASESIRVDHKGIEEIEFVQISDLKARIRFKGIKDDSQWLATFSRLGGLLIVPRIKPRIVRDFKDAERSNLATIRKIELTKGESEFRVNSDKKITAKSKFLGNGKYQIIFPNAKLSEPFSGPRLKLNSPIIELKVREEGTSVVMTIATRLGTALGEIEQKKDNLISLRVNTRSLSNSSISRKPTYNPPVRPQSKPIVVLDAGHGGQDPGTIGIGGVQEKDIILPITLDVAKELNKQGIEVKLTRDRDYFVSLEGRTNFANQIDADLFVSIHANAINLSRPDVNGLETYYYQSGRRLAEIIHFNILNSLDIKDRGVRRARFYVLRHSDMPATLVEVGFLTGAIDSVKLKNSSYRRKMAQAIARGIVQYIKENRI